MSSGSGGAEHASPVAAGGQGAAEDHRGGGGKLPRDPGPAAHPESAQGVSCPLDPGQYLEHTASSIDFSQHMFIWMGKICDRSSEMEIGVLFLLLHSLVEYSILIGQFGHLRCY